MIKRCLKCNKRFPNPQWKKKEKKFCSVKCKSRYNSLKTYYKNKNNPQVKKYQYLKLRQWIENNREHNREYMRNYMRHRLNIKEENYRI